MIQVVFKVLSQFPENNADNNESYSANGGRGGRQDVHFCAKVDHINAQDNQQKCCNGQ
jgi:hypothetical protein